MKYTIDRFEEEFAVLEGQDGTMKNIQKSLLPPDAKEGSRLICQKGQWKIPHEETNSILQRIRAKMKKLWQ